MSNPLVVHCRKSKYDIYCGRPSIYGNPFEIGKDGSREAVINKYRVYLAQKMRESHHFREAIRDLRGKVLGCWCAPLACHCDILAEIANA